MLILRSLILPALVFVLIPSTAAAEKCNGMWGGKVKTSVEFKSGNKLRYCYARECWSSKWLGDKDKKLIFRLNNSGSTVEMTKRRGGYRAVWRNGNRSAKASLSCQ